MNIFSELFSNLPTLSMPRFGLNSILDIALISFVAYRLLVWIRQTRAWTLLKGIITVLIVYLLANTLLMDTTVWLINQSFQWVVFAVLIVFQPELRKALENLGKNRKIPFLSTLEDNKQGINEHSVEELTNACIKMSPVKTGALIVIEQSVPLGDVEQTGIAIDAVVSSQLLINIFEHNTPLHDGAVLIRDNRVKAASCILKLTEKEVASDLGTRHRAAIGISEVSDAYVLVVSEETGRISIAKDGKLYRKLSEEEVRNMLLSGIRPAKARKTRTKKK